MADINKAVKALGVADWAKKADVGKIEVITRKHHLTDAQVTKALKDAGYDVH